MGTYVRTQSIDHNIGERGRISLNVTSGDVRVRGIPGGEAHVRATFEINASSDADADRIFEAAQLRVNRGSGSLNIEETDGGGHSVGSMIGRLFGASGDYELSVEADLPTAAEMQLTAVSSDVTVTDLRGEQRYHTVSGDLNIIAPSLRSLRANTVSGDIQLEAELASDGDFRAETVSGDLSVGLVGSATFEIHGLSTDVSSELDHRLEGQIDRRRLIIGNGNPRLVFNSMSGDVDIRHPRRLSPRPAAPKPASEPTPAQQESQLEVLRALERGEIDVDEATRRLAGGS